MRVLVTRAQRTGQKTAEHLLRLRHEPVLLPLAKPVHAPQAALSALQKPHSALVVTSAEAICALESIRDQLHQHFSTPLFAVGAATAATAQRLGFQQIHTANGDGLALAELLSEHRAGARKNPAMSPMLYLAGYPRAKGLERAMVARALPLAVCEVYRMETMSYQEQDVIHHLDDRPVDVVLLYSAETAKRFCALPLRAEGLKLFDGARFLCLSQQIANSVTPPFNGRLFAAHQPDEESLFCLL